jgi:hypothetical protein
MFQFNEKEKQEKQLKKIAAIFSNLRIYLFFKQGKRIN